MTCRSKEKTMTDKTMRCKHCRFYAELILWNFEGRDLPNYKDKSHCCTLFAREGVVHQRNSGELYCECFTLRGDEDDK